MNDEKSASSEQEQANPYAAPTFWEQEDPADRSKKLPYLIFGFGVFNVLLFALGLVSEDPDYQSVAAGGPILWGAPAMFRSYRIHRVHQFSAPRELLSLLISVILCGALWLASSLLFVVLCLPSTLLLLPVIESTSQSSATDWLVAVPGTLSLLCASLVGLYFYRLSFRLSC